MCKDCLSHCIFIAFFFHLSQHWPFGRTKPRMPSINLAIPSCSWKRKIYKKEKPTERKDEKTHRLEFSPQRRGKEKWSCLAWRQNSFCLLFSWTLINEDATKVVLQPGFLMTQRLTVHSNQSRCSGVGGEAYYCLWIHWDSVWFYLPLETPTCSSFSISSSPWWPSSFLINFFYFPLSFFLPLRQCTFISLLSSPHQVRRFRSRGSTAVLNLLELHFESPAWIFNLHFLKSVLCEGQIY